MTDQLPLFGSDDTSSTKKETPVSPTRGEPLASRMRPHTLNEVIGQEHLLAPGKALRRSIEADHISSMIFWGPPGSGKTTLAEVIAHHTQARFIRVSAVSAGVADLRKIVEEAKRTRSTGKRTIVFIDEIHRFNKAQQDALLPHVENGVITLIGATTENPSFEVNSALLSRARVFVLHALREEQTIVLLQRALSNTERGLGHLNIAIDNHILQQIALYANGDARTAINVLELALQASREQTEDNATIQITLSTIEDVMQHRALLYDKRRPTLRYDFGIAQILTRLRPGCELILASSHARSWRRSSLHSASSHSFRLRRHWHG